MVILYPAIWPYFSWIMQGVDYFDGIAYGIAPFLQGGCEELAKARGGASMVMLAFGAAVIASALVSCIRAGGADSKPVAESDEVKDQKKFEAYIGSFSFMLRIIGLTFGLILSAAAFSYFWLGGGEGRSIPVPGCNANTTLGQAAYICVFGFIALAAPLVVLKNVYRFVYGMGRYRRA